MHCGVGRFGFLHGPSRHRFAGKMGFVPPPNGRDSVTSPKTAGVQQTAPLNKDKFKDTIPRCCQFTCHSALRLNHCMLQQQRHG